MRPGVQATVLRNRVKRVRRRNPDEPHRFSLRRLLLIVVIGTVIFILGIALTVLGYEKGPTVPNLAKDEQMFYKTFGPIGCVVGTGLLIGAAIYYYCFGTGDGYGPRPPQSPSATSYHPISSIRSTASNSHHHRHHGSHRSPHHDNHDGAVSLNNKYLSEHDHHQLMMAAGCAPLAASETASIRDTPTAVSSEISIALDGYHYKHPTTSTHHSNHEGRDSQHGHGSTHHSNHEGRDSQHGHGSTHHSNHEDRDSQHGHGSTSIHNSNQECKDHHQGAMSVHFSNHEHNDHQHEHGASS